MNKWTMWVTGSGLSLLFVAVAVALAHRDSRNEIDPVETTPTVEAQSAAPVTLAWQSPSTARPATTPIAESPPTNTVFHDQASSRPTLGLPTFDQVAEGNNAQNDAADSTAASHIVASGSSPLSSLPPQSGDMDTGDAGSGDFVQLANYEDSSEEVVRGNDETPTPGQPTPATSPAAPAMSPFPFTKQPTPAAAPNTLPSTANSNAAPIAEMAQLPTLPQALQNTQNGLKKVADSAAETATEVGQALDPRRILGGTSTDSNAAPRTLMPAPTGSLPTGTPTTNNMPQTFPGSSNNTNALRNPPASLGAPATIGGAPITGAAPTLGGGAPNNQPTSSANNSPNPNGSAPVATFGSSNTTTNRSISNNYSSGNSLGDSSTGSFSSGRNYATSTYALASADPGERTIEGPQTPALQLIKRAPEEVRVGRNVTFTMIVKNTGTAIARQVQVSDVVPNGTRFVAAQPAIQPDNNGELLWDLGDLPPGNERVIQLQLIPETEGEIGSVASVTFASLASVRTLATQPKITLTHNVAEQVLLSKSFAVQLKITNEGTGVAESVSLEADLPANLKCSAGAQIVADIDRLQPGETKVVDLPLQAIEPGQANLQLRVISEDEEVTQQDVSLLITAPQLQVAIQGPTKRYIERQARYVMKVENIGNASATNLDLVAQLPKGFRFNGTGQKGQYDASRHAVLWSLEELPAGIAAEVELDIIPVDMGAQPLLFQVAADLNAQAKTESTVNVEGLSELSFTISDDNDPVEVEGETNYSIKVTNNGTRADSQVQLVVELPRGANLVGQPDAPVESTLNGNQILFSPLAAMKAKETVEYQFTIRWTEEGQQNVRALVTSQNRSVPVTKEEGIEVYRDR
jgi:uncharacterized repeat protein (TIGR01451 family)